MGLGGSVMPGLTNCFYTYMFKVCIYVNLELKNIPNYLFGSSIVLVLFQSCKKELTKHN